MKNPKKTDLGAGQIWQAKGTSESKINNKSLTFEIPAELPSHNELFKRQNNWRVAYRMRKDRIETWRMLIWVSLKQSKFQYVGNTSYFKKAKIKVMVYRKRLLDPKNAESPVDKLIADNLVKLRIIPDDSAKYLEWEPIEQFKGPPRVVVTLTEID